MSSFSNTAGSLLMIFTFLIGCGVRISSIKHFLNKFAEDEQGIMFFIKMFLTAITKF